MLFQKLFWPYLIKWIVLVIEKKTFWNSRLNFSYRRSGQCWKQNTILNWQHFFLYQIHASKNIWMIQVTNFKFSIAIVIVNSALQLSKKKSFRIYFFFTNLLKSYMLARMIHVTKNLSLFMFSFFQCIFKLKQRIEINKRESQIQAT